MDRLSILCILSSFENQVSIIPSSAKQYASPIYHRVFRTEQHCACSWSNYQASASSGELCFDCSVRNCCHQKDHSWCHRSRRRSPWSCCKGYWVQCRQMQPLYEASNMSSLSSFISTGLWKSFYRIPTGELRLGCYLRRLPCKWMLADFGPITFLISKQLLTYIF